MSDYNWEELVAPFEAREIKWRIQRKNKEATKAAFIPYVDARAVQERLDRVVGQENWKNEKPEPGADGGILCGLSIRINDQWVTKWDGAENTQIEAIKGGLSDGFKRSCVLWGIGRYLYGADDIWTTINQFGDSLEPEKLILKFNGKPLHTDPHPSKLAEPRPASTMGTHEKPATARGATSSRPFGSVEDLAKHLIASKAQQKAKDSLISEGQAKNIGKELGILFKSDEIRAYFLWRVFQIEPDEEGRLSKYMDEKEFFTIKGWLASPLGVLEHEVGVVVSEYTSEAEEKQRG